MYLFTSTRNGVSAKELQRQLGVTYKCAWRIGHQLRILLAARDQANNPGPLSGHVEMDEVYIGGRMRKFEGYGKGEYLKNKSTVFGMVERGGMLQAQVVPRAAYTPDADHRKQCGTRHDRFNGQVAQLSQAQAPRLQARQA